MFGIILSLIYMAIFMDWEPIFGSNMTTENVFLDASSYLYSWYWFWTIISTIFVLIVSFSIHGFGLLVGSAGGNKLTKSEMGTITGGLLGFILGGKLSLNLFRRYVMKRILLLLGTYLLMTSGKIGMSFSDFSEIKLITGGLMLFSSIYLMRNKNGWRVVLRNKKKDESEKKIKF